MAKGSTMPTASRASQVSCRTPRSRNVLRANASQRAGGRREIGLRSRRATARAERQAREQRPGDRTAAVVGGPGVRDLGYRSVYLSPARVAVPASHRPRVRAWEPSCPRRQPAQHHRGRRRPARRARLRAADRVRAARRRRPAGARPCSTRRRWAAWRSRSTSTTSASRSTCAGSASTRSLAMAPFVSALDEFHDLTAPSDWLEGLVKAFVGDGIAHRLLPRGRDLPRRRAAGAGRRGALGQRARAVRRRPGARGDRGRPVGGRPAGAVGAAAGRRGAGAGAAGGRRPRGADRPHRRRRVGSGGLVELGRLLSRLTEAHTKRMAQLGLRA